MTGRAKLLFDLTPLDTPSGPRGIGRYIRDLAIGLRALPPEELEGIEIVGLARLGWSGDCETVSDIGSYEGRSGPQPTEDDFYRWAYRQRLVLWRAVQRIGADALHILDPHATPLFLGLTGCRKIVTCHDLVPTRFPERYFGPKDGGAFVGKKIERRRYRSADLVVAISDATRDDAISLLGVSPHRIVRVHNGIDVERWSHPSISPGDQVLRRLELAGQKFALYVGGSDWRKNVEGMMAALAYARGRGSPIVLAWAGHLQEGHIAEVDRIAREAGVAHAVRRLGYVSDEDLAVLYRAAACHILVSRCEGFGLTVLEAMASGCPVVTTTGGALGEVAGEAALKVDPEDHVAIGEALLTLASEDARRDELVRRGRERARLFSREAQARAMARVYREFMSRTARSG